MISTKAVKPTLQFAYVKLMMDVVGRGLVMASQVDDEVQQEVSKFPVGFILSMNVFPNGPAFVARVTEEKQLELLSNYKGKPDLTITFKHLTHAFLVFSFQESTAQAFANDRMIAGVMGGIAQRLGWSSTWLRVIFVIVSIASAGFPGILIYLILWLLMPEGQG